MTNQTEQTQETVAEPEPEAKYQIDAKAFNTTGRSFAYAVYSRSVSYTHLTLPTILLV